MFRRGRGGESSEPTRTPKMDDHDLVKMMLEVIGRSPLPEMRELVRTTPVTGLAAAVTQHVETVLGATPLGMSQCPRCGALAMTGEIVFVWRETLTPFDRRLIVTCVACEKVSVAPDEQDQARERSG